MQGQSNGQGKGMQVNIERVVGHLQEQIARLSWDLATTKAALDQAMEEKNSGNAGGDVKAEEAAGFTEATATAGE